MPIPHPDRVFLCLVDHASVHPIHPILQPAVSDGEEMHKDDRVRAEQVASAMDMLGEGTEVTIGEEARAEPSGSVWSVLLAAI